MIQFHSVFRISLAALFALCLSGAAAPAPQRIDVQKVSTTIENVVVPLPGEIFGALNKLGSINWKDHVRQELDRTQSSVQQAMNELHDEKLSQLVSLGGWLRGTEVLTAVVSKNFRNEGAELLHQPDLLVHFQTQLQGMPEFRSETRL